MFDALHDILYKESDVITKDLLHDFNYFMSISFLSFYDDMFVEYSNELMNGIFINEGKEKQYKYMKTMIPKLSRKKINYIKDYRPVIDKDLYIPEFISREQYTKNLDLILDLQERIE